MLSSVGLGAVEVRMLDACSGSTGRESDVLQAIGHHLAAGGSRVRAQFSLSASLALGIEEQDAVTLAAICELLHNASLIHDDLLDRAPMRRGLHSVWAAFGDVTAVCAGDLLLASAFGLVGELSSDGLKGVLSLVNRRTHEVILGQDAEHASSPATLQAYERIAIRKSASLLSLPFELSLLLSGNEGCVGTAQRACGGFAVAYQMLDDLFDYDEDVRNGSLNAVVVALAMGGQDHFSARALVCDRAEELIGNSIQDAALLPRQSGEVMMAHAETMRIALNLQRAAKVRPVVLSRHDG